MRKLLAFGLLAVCSLAFAEPYKVVTRYYGGKEVRLPVPSGYCPVEREEPFGALAYQFPDSVNKGKNMIALIFVDCDEWAKLVTGRISRYKNHGQYLFSLANGNVKLMPANFQRQTMAALIKKEEQEKNIFSSDEFREKLKKTGKESVEKATNKEATVEDIPLIKPLEFSDDAIFYEAQVNYKIGSENLYSIAVMGVTIVNRVATSINMFTEGDREVAVPWLLAKQRANIANLIDANP